MSERGKGPRVAAGLAFLFGVGIAFAQDGGSKDPDDLRSVQDGVFSQAQVERGEQRFGEVCYACHQPEELGGPEYLVTWEGQSVGALLDLVLSTMPEDNPGSLSRDEYLDILAYLFHFAGVPVGEEDLPSDPETLAKVVIQGPFGGGAEEPASPEEGESAPDGGGAAKPPGGR